MAKVIQCDRCGNIIKDDQDYKSITIRSERTTFYPIHFELCEDCENKIFKILKGENENGN